MKLLQRTLALLLLIPTTAFCATVSGTVKDAATGQPLAGAKVIAGVINCLGGLCFSYEAGVATADAAGHYTLSALDADNYTFYTAVDHYDNVDQAGAHCYYDHACDNFGTKVVVAQTDALAHVDFSLYPGAVITGHVTAAQGGQPVPDATVFARVHGVEGGRAPLSAVAADGSYRIDGLPAGQYDLTLGPPTGGGTPWLVQFYPDVDCDGLGCTGTAAGIGVARSAQATADFHLRQGGYIAGSIKDAVNAADVVAEVQVRRTGTAGASLRTAIGSYTHGPFLPGAYTVQFHTWRDYPDELYAGHVCPMTGCDPANGTPVQVLAGTTTAHIDATLQPLLRVDGVVRVASTGMPVAGIDVAAVEFTWPFGIQTVTKTTTRVDGSYTLTGFRGHTTMIVRTLDSTGNRRDGAWQGVACDTTNALCQNASQDGIYTKTDLGTTSTLAGVDLTVGPAGSIHGTATQQPSLSGDLAVFAINVQDGRLTTMRRVASDGTFQLGNLPPGDYYLAAAGSSSGSSLGDSVLYPSTPCAFDVATTQPISCDFFQSTIIHVAANASAGPYAIVIPGPDALFSNGFQ